MLVEHMNFYEWVGLEEMNGALFSPDRKYRYKFWRSWSIENKKRLLFIMLNPSIADEIQDDPTQIRCKNFAKGLGFGGYYVGNLYALVSTDPKKLKVIQDPVGPDNNHHLLNLHESCDMTILAWGAHDKLSDPRPKEVLKLLSPVGKSLYCLKLCKDGSPRHPLYLRADCNPIPFEVKT